MKSLKSLANFIKIHERWRGSFKSCSRNLHLFFSVSFTLDLPVLFCCLILCFLFCSLVLQARSSHVNEILTYPYVCKSLSSVIVLLQYQNTHLWRGTGSVLFRFRFRLAFEGLFCLVNPLRPTHFLLMHTFQLPIVIDQSGYVSST